MGDNINKTLEEHEIYLREMINEGLRTAGFSINDRGGIEDEDFNKEKIRNLHKPKREEIVNKNMAFVNDKAKKIMPYFANGSEIDATRIAPEIIEVKPRSLEGDIFRFASLLWSVPVSQGFGRRMRFLVKDASNGKLIGIFALGDPVFNLAARDKWIGWSTEDRLSRLVSVMDAYTVGAVPPYSSLICGKLIASLMGSKEVIETYKRKYYNRITIIKKVLLKKDLALITTTSSMGRSSIYNRLVVPNGPKLIKIGNTKGYGHFHLSGEIFYEMKEYLKRLSHPYVNGNRYGNGPNWRMRIIRTVLSKLGYNPDCLLKHGIEREVYAMPLGNNWKEYLLGKDTEIEKNSLSAAEISEFLLK